MSARDEAAKVVERLRLLVYVSDITQREIERRAAFSRGYLSQILHGHVELKLHHLLSIVAAMGQPAADFFAALFAGGDHPALATLERYRHQGGGRQSALGLELARLYGFGIESIEDLIARLERCEAVLDELTRLGLLKGDLENPDLDDDGGTDALSDVVKAGPIEHCG